MNPEPVMTIVKKANLLLAILIPVLFPGYLFSQARTLETYNTDTLKIQSVTDSIYQKSVKDTLLYYHNLKLKDQEDAIGILSRWFKVKKSEEKRITEKVRWSLFPTSSGITGDKTVLTSFSLSFVLGDIATTKASNVYFLPYLNFGHQYGFQLQPNIWLSNNSWNFTGEYFILNYPQYTWGLGGDSPDENKTLVDYNHLRIHQNVMKQVFKNFSVGLGFSYDRHYDIELESSDSVEVIAGYLRHEMPNSVSSGLVLPVLYDSRKNSVNPQQGFTANMIYSFYDPVFGSDDSWQSLFFDVRKYFSLPARKYRIIALRSYYWTITKGNPPYMDMPSNRWEPVPGSASRGIKQNRYKSNAIIYFESEYRFGISANGLWGGVAFASITAPSQYNTQQFVNWHPAAGMGVRMKFNKYSNTNATLDFGFSKGFATVYLNIGEAF